MLDLAQPKPLSDIVAAVDSKTPIGSVLRTAGWEAMPQALRDQAFFSAGVTSAQFLAAQKKAVSDLIARAKGTNEKGETYWKMDRAQFIAQMRQMGEALNIQKPGGRADGKVREGDVADPVSIARLRLIINTQLELAYGYADWLTGMDPDILEAYPAWELVRISPRRIPRNWPVRWAEAAMAVNWEGVLRDGRGRMIALKTSRIWIALSRFKKPHPPFDFGSGMGVEEIERSEAEDLGLLDADTVLLPAIPPYQASLEASLKGIGPKEKALLQETFGAQVDTSGEVATWTGSLRQPSLSVVQPGRSIAAAFTVQPGIPPTMGEAFTTMQAALDPVLAPIRAAAPLKVGAWDLDKHGYNYRGDGKPIDLMFGEDTGTPHLEAVHEMAHYWAHMNLGQGQPSKGAPVDFSLTAEDWLREVMETEPVTGLLATLKEAKTVTDREAIAYLLQPGELWARCFSEWCAVRSGNAAAMRELSQVLSGQVPGQAEWLYWGNAELNRLLPLLDALLLK